MVVRRGETRRYSVRYFKSDAGLQAVEMNTVAHGQFGYTAVLSRKVLAGTAIAAFWMAEGTMTAFAASLVASRSIERDAWRRPARAGGSCVPMGAPKFTRECNEASGPQPTTVAYTVGRQGYCSMRKAETSLVCKIVWDRVREQHV